MDYEPCDACGCTDFDISATLISCKRCNRLWGRVNGAWILAETGNAAAQYPTTQEHTMSGWTNAKAEQVVAGGAVRGIGFDNTLRTDGKSTEKMFFVGADGKRVEQPSIEQVNEFIAYYEHQLGTARLYLANNCETETTKWTVRGVGNRR